jgi:flagellar P-ring protein precursor FlgI
VRIKDIVDVEGVRENMLIGYGLVVGLAGTGDNLGNSAFTEKGLADFLERLGVNTRGATLKTKNIAAVTVTALLPPFARQGSKISVAVSTMGDAKSLQDGILLPTPLLGADGKAYAVAQGTLSLGGVAANSDTGAPGRVTLTNGTIANGAIVEQEIDFSLESMTEIRLALRQPDFTTAVHIAREINILMGLGYAQAIDPGTVRMRIPPYHRTRLVEVLARIEQVEVNVDKPARIVIDESSGTVVIGEGVQVLPVSITQGNLSIEVTGPPTDTKSNGVFAPNSLVPSTVPGTPEAKRNRQQTVLFQPGVTLAEVVAGLNALGVSPRDLITILRTIKAANAIQAEIIVK